MPVDCHNVGCVCIDTLPIPATVSPHTEQVPDVALLANQAANAGEVATNDESAFAPVKLTLHDRYLSFHQLRL